jgi:hypothetical protein
MLKTKCFTESTFVIIGTDRKTGAMKALLAPSWAHGIVYAGAHSSPFLASKEKRSTMSLRGLLMSNAR